MNVPNFIKRWAASPSVLRPVFRVLRTVRPNAVFGKVAIITRYEDVAQGLVREDLFTVHEIDGYKMEVMGNPFVLGMDASPETTRDRELLKQVIKREDLGRIRDFIKATATELLGKAQSAGRINVATGYARLASVKLVKHYFGVPADEATMMRWQRAIFNEAFANLLNVREIHETGMIAARAVSDHLGWLIKERQQQPGPIIEDNVLNRLIEKKKEYPWLDDQGVKRNILCMLGVVENTSKVVTHIIDQLLKRTKAFRGATAAANEGDIQTVKGYAFEALRFNPHHPFILRYCKKGAVVAEGTSRQRKIPPETTVVMATLSAIFDPRVITNPQEFDETRSTECFHFGWGPHLCTGKYISETTVPELVAALLRLKNLRRAPGSEGHIIYDQVIFPESLILEFDR